MAVNRMCKIRAKHTNRLSLLRVPVAEKYLQIEDQLADLFTEASAKKRFNCLLSEIGLHERLLLRGSFNREDLDKPCKETKNGEKLVGLDKVSENQAHLSISAVFPISGLPPAPPLP